VNAAAHSIIPFTLLVLLSFSPSARANEKSGGPYEQLLLITKNGERLEGRQGKLSATDLTARFSSGAPRSIPLDDIKTLYVAEGNQARLMALSGAGGGLGIGLGAVLWLGPSVWSNQLLGVLGILGGFTAGGALIGGLIGSSMVQWRVQPVAAPGKQYGVQLSLSM
jgi:hypothetical protein